MAEVDDPAVAKESRHRRAQLQFILGLLQMAGVTMGIVLLINTGASNWTIGVVAFTGGVSLSSFLLRQTGSK